jgi:anti-sigma factor RsiW
MSQQPPDQRPTGAATHATAEALAAYALDPQSDASASPSARHIETCVECRAEAAWLRAQLAALEAGPERAACPSVETVTAYALGELSGTEQLIAAAHIRQCVACTEEVAVTREALAVAPGESTAAESPLRAALRRVAAALVPPPALSAARAVRGAEDEGDTLRTYQAEGVEVTLRSERHDTERGQFLIYGTVSQAAGPVAALLVAQGEAATPMVIESAIAGDAFELGPVPPGSYRLDILLADRVVEIAPIMV